MGNVILRFEKFPGQFLLRSDLDCVIDNAVRYTVPQKRPLEIDLPPGPHIMQMAYPYMGKMCGAAGAQIVVQPGMRYQVVYRSQVVVHAPGTISISVIGPPPRW